MMPQTLKVILQTDILVLKSNRKYWIKKYSYTLTQYFLGSYPKEIILYLESLIIKMLFMGTFNCEKTSLIPCPKIWKELNKYGASISIGSVGNECEGLKNVPVAQATIKKIFTEAIILKCFWHAFSGKTSYKVVCVLRLEAYQNLVFKNDLKQLLQNNNSYCA